MANPFTPTFGAVPQYVAGRDMFLSSVRHAFDDAPNSPVITTLIIGPRGSGKTALLSLIADEAHKNGWITADAVPGDSMLEDIYQQILISSYELLDTGSKTRISGINIGQVLGISFESTEKSELTWSNRMRMLVSELNKNGTGVLITVDEIQADDPALVELVSVYQILRRQNMKISLFMAGLPSAVQTLLNGKTVSFMRRANQYYLSPIDDTDVEQTYRKTFESYNRSVTEDGLKLMTKEAGGFPYMMQLIGYYIWECAHDSKKITADHIKAGIRLAKQRFETGVLANTYADLSDGDKRFLFAMLEDPEYSLLKDIAERLGKPQGYCSTYKKRLLASGIIEERAGKRLYMILPSFREYLEKQKEDEAL